MLHRLGEPADQDVLLYEETDETFWVAVHESRSREFVLLHCEQTDRAEAWAIPSGDRPPARAGSFPAAVPTSSNSTISATGS